MVFKYNNIGINKVTTGLNYSYIFRVISKRIKNTNIILLKFSLIFFEINYFKKSRLITSKTINNTDWTKTITIIIKVIIIRVIIIIRIAGGGSNYADIRGNKGSTTSNLTSSPRAKFK